MAHVVEDRDMIDVMHAKCAHLYHHIFAVADHMICAQILYPRARLWPRCRRDDDQPSLLGKLDADRPYTAGGADDQDRLALVGAITINAQAIEKRLIGGDRCQRKGGGFCVGQ